MKRKMYDYLIAYTFSKEGYLASCTGTMCLSRVNKIDSFSEVRLVQDYIAEQIEGSSNIAINNITFLGRNKHEV
jgi:hypothetical protein